jgi:hypothetical protein
LRGNEIGNAAIFNVRRRDRLDRSFVFSFLAFTDFSVKFTRDSLR